MEKVGGGRVVIIGAGPCGLGAAWRLQELGHSDFLVLERAEDAGGLACTEVDEQGFLWDMGGHVVFSHYQYFDKLLDYCNRDWCEKERVCYVWQRDRFIPYPFQNNIHRLPKEDLQKCLDGLIELERTKNNLVKPKNFLEWLRCGFGNGIVDIFLLPYNRKVWGFDPSEMNTEWMGERVATVDLKRVMDNVVTGKDDASWGPNNKFRFPLRGGTGAIWKGLYDAIDRRRFRFNSTVQEVNTDSKTLTLTDGTKIDYDVLVSTMPLSHLCKVVKGKGLDHLPGKAPLFRYSTTHVVGIGLEGQPPPHLRSQCWMYFPEDDCPFYRVTVFSNYSPFNVPKPGYQWSLMAEVCETPNRPVNNDSIVADVIQGFYNTKLMAANDKVLSRYHRRLEYGYPTPFLGRDELCGPILTSLEGKSVYSRGRFGAWKYEVSNQDHSLMQGVEAVDHVLFGSEEMTLRYPSVVNDRSWKNVGRLPRVKAPPASCCYDPASLVKDILGGETEQAPTDKDYKLGTTKAVKRRVMNVDG